MYNYITADFGVDICYADVSEISVNENEISEYRKNRISLIKSEAARKQSLAAEVALISLAKKLELTDVFPLEYKADENGKPYFADRQDVHFSLSHSGDIAVCAMAKSPVGVDVQEIKTPNMKLAEKYFTENELKTNDGSRDWFMRIWARKEAVLKAEGTGISLGLSKIDVSCDNVVLNGEKYYVQDIAIQDKSYCMAVAVKIFD